MLSVIIPIYNSEKYIEDCLKSITNQSFKDFEMILVDNNSTDSSLEICQKFANTDERIRIFREDKRGAAAARNRGICEAKGEYITFVDSDDYVAADAYATLMDKLIKNDADFIGFGYRYIDEWGNELGWYSPKLSRYNDVIQSGKSIASIFLTSKDIEGFGWNKIFRRSIFIKNNILFDEEKKAFEDMAILFSAILECERCLVCANSFYYYRQQVNSLTHSEYENKNQEYEIAINTILSKARQAGFKQEAECFEISRNIEKVYNARKNFWGTKSGLQLKYSDLHCIYILIRYYKSEKAKTLLKYLILRCT